MGLAAAILGTSMAFIDGTVVNVALPLCNQLRTTVMDCSGWESYGLLLAALSGGRSAGETSSPPPYVPGGRHPFRDRLGRMRSAHSVHALIVGVPSRAGRAFLVSREPGHH